MAKKPLAEITEDGCLLLHAGGRDLRYSLTDWVRERLFVAEVGEKRALQDWLRAVEGKPALPKKPDIPASRPDTAADGEVMTWPSIPGGGIRVIVGEEGITVLFVASNGREVVLDCLAVAGALDPDERATMLQWCRDRLSDAAALDLPEDVRRRVEAEIDQIAKRR